MPHIPKLMIFQSPRFRECSSEEYYFRHSWKKKKKKLLIVLLWQNRVTLFALYWKEVGDDFRVLFSVTTQHALVSLLPPHRTIFTTTAMPLPMLQEATLPKKKNGCFPNFSKMTQILPGFLLLLPKCSHTWYNMYHTYYVSCHTQLCVTFWSRGL